MVLFPRSPNYFFIILYSLFPKIKKKVSHKTNKFFKRQQWSRALQGISMVLTVRGARVQRPKISGTGEQGKKTFSISGCNPWKVSPLWAPISLAAKPYAPVICNPCPPTYWDGRGIVGLMCGTMTF